jgi:hypothetical protein
MHKRLLTLFSGGAAAASTYTISGTVYDADGSTAVSGATVAIGAASATSAANGTYSITGLAAGTSGSLTCTLSGYSWTAISVSAMAGDLAGQNFTNVWYAAGGSLASCVIAYKPLGAADVATSKVNLANPGTYNGVFSATAPTWASATGWTFDGTNNKYVTTGYVPPNQVGRSAAVRISGGASDAVLRWIFCSTATTPAFGIRNTSNGAGNGALFHNGTNSYLHSGPITSGVLAVAGLDPYKDGSDLGNITAGTYDLGASGLEIGRLAQTNSQRFNGNVLAFAVYSATLNATQIGILSTAMANLA